MVQKREVAPGEFSRFWGGTGEEGKKRPAATGGWASFGINSSYLHNTADEKIPVEKIYFSKYNYERGRDYAKKCAPYDNTPVNQAYTMQEGKNAHLQIWIYY